MTPAARVRAPTVVLMTAQGTLARVDRGLERAGVRAVRIRTLQPHAIDPLMWIRDLSRQSPPDTVVVTSRWGVLAGVKPWRAIDGPFPDATEFWASGPATATALRRVGVTHIHTPKVAGSDGIAWALRRGPKRDIAYLHSPLGGEELIGALRAQGHRVTPVVVYEIEMPPPLTAAEKSTLRAADVLVITSPSMLGDLAHRLSRAEFQRIAQRTTLVVLGELSRQAGVERGFAHISVAPSVATQPFTRHLLREVRNARK
jgi:uroporphyrinogen-III synthase